MQAERRVYLGVDLGATNCRVAIQSADGGAVTQIAKFECHSASSLLKSLAALHADVASHGRVYAACLAAAGPVAPGGASVSITNWPADDQAIRLAALPEMIFPRGRTRLGNDMEAGAMGLVALEKDGKLGDAFRALWKSEHEKVSLVPHAQHLVLAVGTGLGVASLCPPVVLPMEGCHARLVPCAPLAPEAASERQLFEFLSRRVWNGEQAPEWEDVCSGRGITHVYDWLTQADHTTSAELSPPQIVDMARDCGCGESLRAIQTHYKMLARFSQYYVVSLQAKAVFWMGDNLVDNMDLVEKFTADLKAEFLASSKPQWVAHCPIFVQTKKDNFNMLGALYLARQLGA